MRKEPLKILLAALAGFLVNILLLLFFYSIGLIDPLKPIQDLLADRNLDENANYDALGKWFIYWNLVTFSFLSSQGFINLSFNITYLLLLLVFIIACIVIALLSYNRFAGIISLGIFLLLNICFGLIAAKFLINDLYIGALPPTEQSATKSISDSLIRLSFLLPFKGMIFAFAINVAIALLCIFIFCKFSILKK